MTRRRTIFCTCCWDGCDCGCVLDCRTHRQVFATCGGLRDGCVYGKDCVNPHPYHESHECATAEQMEAYGKECADE